MKFRVTWYYSGFVGSLFAIMSTWILAHTCNTESNLCTICGRVYEFANAPARLIADPLLRGLGHLLGQRQAGPDAIVAPPGVLTTLGALGWLAFVAYWFALGVCAYYLCGLVWRKFLHKSESLA